MQNKKDVETAEENFLAEAAHAKTSKQYGGPLEYAKWGDWLPSDD
jgi:hypothetical protein